MLRRMRTTLRLNDRLLSEVKRTAMESGCTLTAFIEDALREALARRKTRRSRRPLGRKAVGGRGALPGVDLDDPARLRDLMDRRDAPR